tara:strand:- start:928 stop:1239 length:312 start_codon:yes stop_codon:yes gene_type:complete
MKICFIAEKFHNYYIQKSQSQGCFTGFPDLRSRKKALIQTDKKPIAVKPKKTNVYINQVCISLPKIKILTASAFVENPNSYNTKLTEMTIKTYLYIFSLLGKY